MTEAGQVDLTLLNHASMLIEAGDVRLLTDPWYFGVAFESGWGLRYDNPAAMERAATATHLWISHFHEDHLHFPTLRELVVRNPNMIFLANDSYNFDMTGVAARIGFRNIQSFLERVRLSLGDGVTATRYPTTGIDNMLVLKGPDWTILNFNDCVISDFAARLLSREIGKVDIFLGNFNHAGKLLRKEKIEDAKVKSILIDNFRKTHAPFNPRYIIPFASHHYYRAPESADQNSSMLTIPELVAIEAKVVPVEVGGCATYRRDNGSVSRNARDAIALNPFDQIARPGSIGFDDLRKAALPHVRKVRSGFGVLARAVPPLRIRISDLDRTATLDVSNGLKATSDAPDIECHSTALHAFLSKTYGTDSFAVGAHFRIRSKRKARLILTIATGLLAENKLDPRSLLSMLISRGGLRFLLNRREEILGILVSRKVYADYHKE